MAGTKLLSDGTAVVFRELTKSEWNGMEQIKTGGNLKICGETLTTDALVMLWTITRAVLSRPTSPTFSQSEWKRAG